MRYLISLFFFALLVTHSNSVRAQDWTLVKNIETRSISSVSIDNRGFLFVSDNDGLITKYDTNGEEILSFSPNKSGAVSLLESWPTIQTFAFYQDFQEYILFDRFLTPTSRRKLSAPQIGYAGTASIGTRKRLWVFDETDLCLKQYDFQSDRVLSNTFLTPIMENDNQEINYIREYQNLVFINNATEGIFIFDNLGNFEKKIPVTDLSYFNFANNELYYLKDHKIVFTNIYSLESRTQVVNIYPYNHILLHKDTAYLIGDSGFDIYSIP